MAMVLLDPRCRRPIGAWACQCFGRSSGHPLWGVGNLRGLRAGCESGTGLAQVSIHGTERHAGTSQGNVQRDCLIEAHFFKNPSPSQAGFTKRGLSAAWARLSKAGFGLPSLCQLGFPPWQSLSKEALQVGWGHLTGGRYQLGFQVNRFHEQIKDGTGNL
jgi:hypothetical protein